MEAPLKELKMKLLQDDGVSMFVVTAPGGCGKTTLATKFCQDEHVKGKFKDNIFFVTVSKNPSLNHIVEQLYRHKGSEVPTFHNEVNAVNWLQTFLRNEGKKPLLLVLDDVWSGSESLLDKFQIAIPDYRILVTSRSDFPAFSAPFHLPLLVQDDAVKLFHHSASLEDKSSYIPKHLSQKIIERCKGFPLAIKVVGRSLCAQPIEMWQKRVIEWSKGSSILDSETDLLLCLQSSLDALDKQKTIIKECFLDLGSFPEDKRIPVTALIDMWAELYDLDEEALCLANLYELSNWSLANVVDNSRFMKMHGEGYYGKYYVTQHDLLRELAIYHAKLDSVEHQKRLFIDISGGIFPKWWREQKYQSIHARLLSITADRVLSTEMQFPDAEVLVLNLPKTDKYVLPGFVEKMGKLKVLVVINGGFSCTQLSNFQILSSLPNLKRIRLESISVPSITTNPVEIQFKSLEKILLSICEISGFMNSPVTPSDSFRNLKEIHFHSCLHVGNFPVGISDLLNLKKLIINEDHYLSALPKDIGNLVELEVLRLRSCFSLSTLPDSISNLKKLKFLDLYNCTSIHKLPDNIGEMRSLRKLDVRRCMSLRKLPQSILNLEQLEEVIYDTIKRDLWIPLAPSLLNRNKDLRIVEVEFIIKRASDTAFGFRS